MRGFSESRKRNRRLLVAFALANVLFFGLIAGALVYGFNYVSDVGLKNIIEYVWNGKEPSQGDRDD